VLEKKEKLHMKKLLYIFLITVTPIIAQVERDELFNEVEMILDKAKFDNADLLCKESYNTALGYYLSAKELNSKSELPLKIREELENSITYLTKMNNGIEGKMELFSPTIEQRNGALASDANKYAKYFWNLGEMKLNEALNEYDDGNLEQTKKYLNTTDDYYSTAKLYSSKAKKLTDNSEVIGETNKYFAQLLAPISFAKAEDKMLSTLDAISIGRKLSEIDKLISDTELLFEDASKNATAFSKEYHEVINARRDAKTVEAEKYTYDIWKEGEELLIESAEAFENEKFDKANEFAMEAKLKYTLAKHTSLKDYFLNDTRNEIQLAIDEGAEEFAPITLKKSQDYLSEVTLLIESDNYSLSKIKNLTENALSSAKNARYITEIAKRLEPGEQSWEEIILTQQGEALLPQVNNDEDKILPDKNLSSIASDLEEYLKDDAEVIDKDDVVIIRLTKVNFSTMSSNLNDDAKASLNIIAEALKQNHNAETTIFCYTDNIGTKAANLALSQKRAEAVFNYIKKRYDSTQLFMEGKGEENPIFSNSTADGRIKNRRVEIEIRK